MTTTARLQTTAPVTTLGETDPAAIATFLKGVPLDDAFWRRVRYQCAQCGQWGTTASGALWRVSLADSCTNLYYLHTGHRNAYKQRHGLQSVEGRVPLPLTGAAALPGAGEERRQATLAPTPAPRRQSSPETEVIADVELATVARPDDYRRLYDDEPLPDGYHGPRGAVRVRDPRG